MADCCLPWFQCFPLHAKILTIEERRNPPYIKLTWRERRTLNALCKEFNLKIPVYGERPIEIEIKAKRRYGARDLPYEQFILMVLDRGYEVTRDKVEEEYAFDVFKRQRRWLTFVKKQ